jgi:hypothetical protein
MIKSSMQLVGFQFEELCTFSLPPFSKKIQLTYTYKSRAKDRTICGQLQKEVISKFFKQGKRTSNFHEFWSEELHYEKWPKIIII